MRDNTKIGLRGEILVHEILPESIISSLLPEDSDHDIFWNGITIKVKTTSIVKGGKKLACTFSSNANASYSEAVLVLVCLHDGSEHFWVENPKSLRTYFRIEEALTREDLANAITDTAKRNRTGRGIE